MKRDSQQKELALQTLRLYWEHALKYKAFVGALFVIIPVTALVFNFLPPLILASILERVSSGDFTRHDLWGSFGSDLLLYAALSMLGGIVLWRIAVIFIWKLENNIVRDIHQRIFAHMLELSANFHANRFGGSLVSQANKFAAAYVRIADTIIFELSTLLLAFIFTTVILWSKAPWVVVFLWVFSLVYITLSILVTKKVRALNAVEADMSNKQTGFLADAITNVLAVKSFARGPYEKRRYGKATENTRDAAESVMRASTLRDALFSGLTSTLSVAAVVIAMASVVVFDANVATVFLVITYTSNISQRLWDFSQHTLRNVNKAIGDARDMTEILAIEPSVKDPEKPEKVRIKKGAISFCGVTFAHAESSEDELLFQKLNLDIASGEKVGLVGHSGSGKTSLTKLLLRYNDIDDGEILIDGQNIAQITQDDLRQNIAYVPQEPLLFHRTISENISYGRPNATDEQIREAARKAHAHEFVEKLPQGYDTLVGERGVKLSGGQRQRIAIARAILKDAPILVLDEATSALDSESEKLIQEALWELMKGRTAIVIAHRLSTVQKMDRILVLEDGSITEQGNHTKLVKKGGVYASLWAHQSGGFFEE